MSQAPDWPCYPVVPFHTNRGAGRPTGNPLLGTCASLSVPLWPEAPHRQQCALGVPEPTHHLPLYK
ncbi:hypothetical protein PAL_GLEAN10022810 [Pteropus alecto]|uniref:Uncharacterized protein n=1 Tax=Pteropus alecto TaxID=9402 RepID=L5K4R8_PTEAL|nr:hypothetical protein PAL_GLEAN10022810 [Pteropus alecto]